MKFKMIVKVNYYKKMNFNLKTNFRKKIIALFLKKMKII